MDVPRRTVPGKVCLGLAILLIAGRTCMAVAGRTVPSVIAGAREPIPRWESSAHDGCDARWNATLLSQDRLASQEAERGRAEAKASIKEVEPDRALRVSPVAAFLMSAALPGSGQLVEGRNRAFAYLGVEILSWVSHFAWKDAAVKKEDEYESYADRHWDLDAWRETKDQCTAAIPPGDNPAELELQIQRLRVEDTDDYYELLGKDDGYRGGWDDFECSSPDEISPSRGEYRDMRDDKNTFLKRARMATTVVFLNRIVSAVDAYRTARGARLSVGAGTGLEIGVGGSLVSPRASLRLVRQF